MAKRVFTKDQEDLLNFLVSRTNDPRTIGDSFRARYPEAVSAAQLKRKIEAVKTRRKKQCVRSYCVSCGCECMVLPSESKCMECR